MCQECQEFEVGYSESSEVWDQTIEYGSEEKLLDSVVKEEVSGKVCTKCGEWKPLTEFWRDKAAKDGFCHTCKDCVTAYSRWRKSPDFKPVREKRAPLKGSKRCSKCGEIKQLSEFSWDKNTKDGLCTSCKACVCAYAKYRLSPDFVPFDPINRAKDGMKRCIVCGVVKEVSCFYADKKRKDGLQTCCKECGKERKRVRDEQKREEFKTRHLEFEGTKICTICGEEKSVIEFSFSVRGKNGLRSSCKSCESIKARKKDQNRIVVVDPFLTKLCAECGELKSVSAYYINKRCKDGLASICKECVKKRSRILRASHNYLPSSEGFKLCYLCKIEKPLSEFYKNRHHRDGLDSHCKECENKRKKDYLESNVEAKIRIRVRGRFVQFLKMSCLEEEINKEAAIEFMGCTIPEFRTYIEAQFYKDSKSGREMTWDNYGRPNGMQGERGWDFEHSIPLSRVTLQDPEQQKLVCHFSNIHPMWNWENGIKSNKLPSEMVA